jgi:hypothetical protein
MSSLTFFLQLKVSDLELIVEGFKEDFDIMLKDTFSDDELLVFEPKLDAIAAIFVQPILSELTFDDFYPTPGKEKLQQEFFENCKSSISLENIPFLESNIFQVTYLRDLLSKLPEVLIDRGGVSELIFKEEFLAQLSRYKGLEAFVQDEIQAREETRKKSSIPVDPIDFLILDVYKELNRLKENMPSGDDLSPKVRTLYDVMNIQHYGGGELFRRTGLNAKDFDDCLERLKFWLRKH